ncbi:MAG: hypothetical protein ACK5MP_12225 [Nostocoides sp.]
MSTSADLVTTLLARHMVQAACEHGVRVLAVTSPTSLIAGLMAQRLGADRLALAGGFGRLDVAPQPALTSGEFAMGMAASPRSMSAETFMALARGRVGVVVSPAQIDARAALNLSGIGGTTQRPQVALPGSRGLPDNNHSASTVWYFAPELSVRRLVPEVDFVSGAPPPPGIPRVLVSPTATLAFRAELGWRIAGLSEGVTVQDVRDSVGFELACDGPPVYRGPSPEEAEVMSSVDPHGLRQLDFGPLPEEALSTVLAEEAEALAVVTASARRA